MELDRGREPPIDRGIEHRRRGRVEEVSGVPARAPHDPAVVHDEHPIGARVDHDFELLLARVLRVPQGLDASLLIDQRECGEDQDGRERESRAARRAAGAKEVVCRQLEYHACRERRGGPPSAHHRRAARAGVRNEHEPFRRARGRRAERVGRAHGDRRAIPSRRLRADRREDDPAFVDQVRLGPRVGAQPQPHAPERRIGVIQEREDRRHLPASVEHGRGTHEVQVARIRGGAYAGRYDRSRDGGRAPASSLDRGDPSAERRIAQESGAGGGQERPLRREEGHRANAVGAGGRLREPGERSRDRAAGRGDGGVLGPRAHAGELLEFPELDALLRASERSAQPFLQNPFTLRREGDEPRRAAQERDHDRGRERPVRNPARRRADWCARRSRGRCHDSEYRPAG